MCKWKTLISYSVIYIVCEFNKIELETRIAAKNASIDRPKCSECGGELRYVKRVIKKNAVRMRCKTCPNAQYIPDNSNNNNNNTSIK